jgi:hypothetical protein
MGFHLSNEKTYIDYSSNLLVEAEIEVEDDTKVSGVGFDVGGENTWVGRARGFRLEGPKIMASVLSLFIWRKLLPIQIFTSSRQSMEVWSESADLY